METIKSLDIPTYIFYTYYMSLLYGNFRISELDQAIDHIDELKKRAETHVLKFLFAYMDYRYQEAFEYL